MNVRIIAAIAAIAPSADGMDEGSASMNNVKLAIPSKIPRTNTVFGRKLISFLFDSGRG